MNETNATCGGDDEYFKVRHVSVTVLYPADREVHTVCRAIDMIQVHYAEQRDRAPEETRHH